MCATFVHTPGVTAKVRVRCDNRTCLGNSAQGLAKAGKKELHGQTELSVQESVYSVLQSAALHRLHMASSRRPAESARHPCTPNPTAQQLLQHKAVIPLQENLRITKKNMNLCFLCNCWRVQTAFQDTVWMLLLFIYLCKYSALARSETSCRQFHMVDGKRVVPLESP